MIDFASGFGYVRANVSRNAADAFTRPPFLAFGVVPSRLEDA
jgi:hypothetical protein